MCPSDQQAWFGIAEAVFAQDRPEDADEVYRKAIYIDAKWNRKSLCRLSLRERICFRGAKADYPARATA